MTAATARWVALIAVACSCCIYSVELGPGGSSSESGPDYIKVGEVPDAAIERLRAAPDAGDKGVDLVYPAQPELAIPADLAPIGFEWRASGEPKPMMPMAMPMMPMMPAMPMMMPMSGKMMMPPKAMEEASARVFELSLIAGDSVVQLYTLATSASVPVERWLRLLRAAVGQQLNVRVRALRVSDGEISGSKPFKIDVRPGLPAGEILSWSATGGGLARASIGSSHETRIAVPGVTGCVGCHAVSRDGKRVLAVDGSRGRLVAWSMTGGGAPLEIPLTGQGDAFGSFDVSALRIVVAQGSRLALFDADTGQLLGERTWPATVFGSLDWSSDNRTIAIAASDSLARVRVEWDGRIGELERIVADKADKPKDEREGHPSFSPDGNFIAFERRKGPMREAKDTSLWIVSVAGGEPRELAAAMSGAKPAEAPSFLPGDVPGRAWVVFAARRTVGSFMPAEGQRQLFAAAIDLQPGAAKDDPSHAAFWLPFQQRGSSYLGAQWAPATLECDGSAEICDQVDNICDGKVADACCEQAERCEGKLDEDCDGTIDEGCRCASGEACRCAFQERCGDGVDDDCDLAVDEEPCTPAGK